MKYYSTFLIAILFVFNSIAAEKIPSFKFGKISTSDFEEKLCPIDSGAEGYFLFESGFAEISASVTNQWKLFFDYHCAIKIVNKEGLNLADFEIPLYRNNNQEEQLLSIKGYTYSMEGGKVIKTKLTNDNIFTEKVSDNKIVKKITFPNVKEALLLNSVTEPLLNFYGIFKAGIFKVIYQNYGQFMKHEYLSFSITTEKCEGIIHLQ